MDIVQLLLQQKVRVKLDGVVVLLPELIIVVVAVLLPGPLHQPEHPIFAALLRVILYGLSELGGSIAFKVAQDVLERLLLATDDQVHVVCHDTVGVHFQALLPSAVVKAIE